MKNLIWLTTNNAKQDLTKIPSTTGVYRYMSGDKPVYIGKSVNLKARLLSHYNSTKLDAKEALIKQDSDSIQYTITDNEFKALLLESQLIRHHQPHYNRIWKDDKSYLYIKITNDEYPLIYPVRKESDGKSTYFGPFPSNRVVQDLLKSIRRVVPFCTRKSIGQKACFYSKIGLCNPCPSHVINIPDSKTISTLKRQYRTNIKKITRILSGNTTSIIRTYYQEIKTLAQEQEYEKALALRNKITRFERYITLHSFSISQQFQYNQSVVQMESLLDTLKPHFPDLTTLHRIECYDASTFQLQDSTASMAVLTDGLIDKSQYRRFKIKNPRVRSDFGMLEEALRRRLGNDWPLPNLIVLDGGKPQLRRIQKLFDLRNINIPLVGIAKHPDRLIISTDKMKTLKLTTHDIGFNLLRLIRDESHRFAHSYQLKLRQKIH